MEHHVYFWLKEEKSNAADRAEFEAGLKKLLALPQVSDGAWGQPAGTEVRPVTENSWDYALSMKFATQADHDAYQIDPDHDVFVAQFKEWWAKVMVMDLETK